MVNRIRLLVAVACWSVVAAAFAEPLGEYWGTAEREEAYYTIVDLPVPEEMSLECGSFEVLADGRLAIGTRRGEIWLLDGAFEQYPKPRFELFASGLDEVLGLGERDGSLWITQQTEVTRVTDRDGDGRADQFETISDAWGFNHYHEFAFGSKPRSASASRTTPRCRFAAGV